jgi:hypothetical protein
MLFLYYFLGKLFGREEIPARDIHVRMLYTVVTYADVFFLQLLIFAVLDTTWLCPPWSVISPKSRRCGIARHEAIMRLASGWSAT